MFCFFPPFFFPRLTQPISLGTNPPPLNQLQCEDERFELDMVIEAGTNAINLLEPMEDEINAIDTTAGVGRWTLAWHQVFYPPHQWWHQLFIPPPPPAVQGSQMLVVTLSGVPKEQLVLRLERGACLANGK